MSKKIKFVYTVYGKKYALVLINGLLLGETKVEANDYFVDEEAKQVLLNHGIPEYRIHNTFGENVYIDKILNAMKFSMEKPDYLVFGTDASCIMKKQFEFYNLIHDVERFFEDSDKEVYLQSPNFWNIFGYECQVPEFTKYNEGICAGFVIYNKVSENTFNTFLNTYRDLSSGKIGQDIHWYTYTENSENRYNQHTKITEEKVLEYILNIGPRAKYDVDFEVFSNVPYPDYPKFSIARALNNIFLEIFNWGSGNMIEEMIQNKRNKYNGEYYIDHSLEKEFWELKDE